MLGHIKNIVYSTCSFVYSRVMGTTKQQKSTEETKSDNKEEVTENKETAKEVTENNETVKEIVKEDDAKSGDLSD